MRFHGVFKPSAVKKRLKCFKRVKTKGNAPKFMKKAKLLLKSKKWMTEFLFERFGAGGRAFSGNFSPSEAPDCSWLLKRPFSLRRFFCIKPFAMVRQPSKKFH